MPQQYRATAKEHYCYWFMHRNKLYCHNRLNLENSMKITTKIRIIGRKTDEGWSYMNDAIITQLLDIKLLPTRFREIKTISRLLSKT